MNGLQRTAATLSKEDKKLLKEIQDEEDSKLCLNIADKST
jgi:hypothetical protein